MSEDADYNRFGNPFDKSIISKTFIVILNKVIDEVETKRNRKADRIEDLLSSTSAIYRLVRPRSDQFILNKVKKAVEDARDASVQAMLDYIVTAPRNEDGFVRDICGFAYVITYDSATEVTKALLDLKLATSRTHFYIVDAIGEIPTELQQQLGDKLLKANTALAFEEARAKAAAVVLTKALNQEFSVHSVWD